LLFTFRGVTEVEVPAERIHTEKQPDSAFKQSVGAAPQECAVSCSAKTSSFSPEFH
jgi:hypothetical protein